MVRYLWINPVAEKMYGDNIDCVKEELIKKGYILVGCEPQLDYVKEEYINYSKKVTNTILDCRCPEAISLLKREGLTSGFEIPTIEPILLRTSRVLYEKYIEKSEDVLIITCPCTQLRDFAKEKLQGKTGVEVYTWKEFSTSVGISSLGKTDKSPIPLGFFKNSFQNIKEISEKNEIIKEIKNIKKDSLKKYQIIEMLYCKDGCNNGDGL